MREFKLSNPLLSKEQYEEMSSNVTPIQRIETEEAGKGTKFCDGEYCEL